MEERKCKRMAVEVGCWLVEMDGASCLYTFDISDSGVSVVTEDPLPVGQIVRLQFFTPSSASAVTLEAEVIWSRLELGGGMGLKFLNPGEEGGAIIQEFTRLLRMRKESDTR